jgi:hypothetical protein
VVISHNSKWSFPRSIQFSNFLSCCFDLAQDQITLLKMIWCNSFLCFALLDSFSTIPRTWGPICMFCTPRLHFRRYQGRRVPYSFFTFPDSFWAISRASSPVFMLCAPRLIFNGTKGVKACFHVLHSRTHFGRYRDRRVPFSCFALRHLFGAVPRASGSVFMYCAPGLVLGDTEGAGSCFHVLRSWTTFRRYRGRRVPFVCFALPDSFSAVPRAPGPVFIFSSPELFLGGTESVMSRFLFFALSNYFLTVPRVSCLVCMFCIP